MTEIEEKIREINNLNKQITFEYIPAIHEALSAINGTHDKLMNKYRELVELHKEVEDKE